MNKINKGVPNVFLSTALMLLLAGFLQSGVLLYIEYKQVPADLSQLLQLFSCIFLVIVVFVYTRKKMSIESMGIKKEHFLSHYLLGHFLGFITLSGALLITMLFQGATFLGFALNDVLLWILFFIGFMIQGFEEELLCRGFMMAGLKKEMSVFAAMMVNSLFFAALHWANPGISILALLNLFLAGLSFSAMAVYFDDLWVASGAHSMWNFAQGNIYGILVSGMSMGPTLFRFELKGMDFISGGNFGLEGGIGVFFIELLTLLVFVFLWKRKKSLSDHVA